MSSSSARYRRAAQFASLGVDGQQRIEASRVLVCGCGALGSVIAERLARSGVGHMRIVDRDWVEHTNLQRQTLFTEEDARNSEPKAIAAATALRAINSEIEIEPLVEDVTHLNIQRLAADVDLILDGTDNFETRLLINDYAMVHRVPWVHGGCLGSSGQVMSILPGETACFRCLVTELPPRDALPTCDTAGVLGPAIGVIASWQAAEALKILSGHREAVCRQLITIDTWHTSCRMLSLDALRAAGSCPACTGREFPFLSGERAVQTTVLCGKNAVQLSAASATDIVDLDQLSARLQSVGTLTKNPFLLRLKTDTHVLTVFRDGRTIVEGTTETAEARTIVARLLGS
ncbi:MAG: ThiF family adenylyltransferase [Pirellulaceae bacterium]|nr:ThiF family adenylyltransferase [Pirellulaceae bacterium]